MRATPTPTTPSSSSSSPTSPPRTAPPTKLGLSAQRTALTRAPPTCSCFPFSSLLSPFFLLPLLCFPYLYAVANESPVCQNLRRQRAARVAVHVGAAVVHAAASRDARDPGFLSNVLKMSGGSMSGGRVLPREGGPGPEGEAGWPCRGAGGQGSCPGEVTAQAAGGGWRGRTRPPLCGVGRARTRSIGQGWPQLHPLGFQLKANTETTSERPPRHPIRFDYQTHDHRRLGSDAAAPLLSHRAGAAPLSSPDWPLPPVHPTNPKSALGAPEST